MNYDMKRSGAYIQNLRIQKGYTQGQMAKALNMDRSCVPQICDCQREDCRYRAFLEG